MIEDGNILFAPVMQKDIVEKRNDIYINKQLMKALTAGGLSDVIVLHESSKLKKQRRLRQWSWSSINQHLQNTTAEDWIKKVLLQLAGISLTNCLHRQWLVCLQ